MGDKSTSDFVIKMLGGGGGGGGYARGGRICGTLRYFQCEARYSEQVQGTGQLSSCGLPVQSSLRLPKDFNQPQDGTVCFLTTTCQQPASNLPATSQQPASNLPATGQQPASNLPATCQQPASNQPATCQQPASNLPATGQQPASNQPAT